MPAQNKYQRVTISDVATRAGVSTATVSRVVNGGEGVAARTVAIVNQAIQDLNYRPNAAAQGLARQRAQTISLVVDEVGGEYFSQMLRGVQQATSDAGYDLLIYATRRNPTFIMPQQNADGVIVFANSLRDAEILRLGNADLPVVLLHGTRPPGCNAPLVTVENQRGAYELTQYLLEVRQYRRFAFLRGADGHDDALMREQGYREALTQHGLDYDQQVIGRGDFEEETSREVVTQWLRRGLKMDVIVAADDDSAIGAMVALRDAGLRIPEDVAVVGYDDIRLARFYDPPLTTVRVAIEESAHVAVEQLIHYLKHGSAESTIRLPTELVIRRSCGCC
jgi:DNA-binding LacI/PurR family transcriptional regulator